MRLLVQRVKKAEILINDSEIRNMDKGLLVYISFSINDINETEKLITKAVDKLLKLRFFENDEEKLKRNIKDINGDIMIVPNFSLYAKCDKGTTLSFDNSLNYQSANLIYDKFVEEIKEKHGNIVTGEFRSNMKIDSISDGPLNVLIEI